MLHLLNYLRERQQFKNCISIVIVVTLVTLQNKNQQVVFYISFYDYAVIIIVKSLFKTSSCHR